MAPFPEIDPTIYRWGQSTENPRQWRRQAVGSETNWLMKPRLFREIFISASLTLESAVDESTFWQAVRAAWVGLRLEYPDVVARPVVGEDGSTIYIQYESPENRGEVDAWLQRTVFVKEPGPDVCDFRGMRSGILNAKGELETDQVFLLVHPTQAPDNSDSVVKAQVLLNTDHRFTDGIATRILLGRYLAQLAASLSEPAPKDPDDSSIWQESAQKLAPAWPTILNADQIVSGPEYQKAVAENKVNLSRLKTNPGLPLLQELDPPTQELHFITLDESRTAALLTAIKQKLYKGATVTHVGHAAMVLAMLRLQILPAAAPDTRHDLHSPCWLSGRRYLLPYGDHRDPLTSYVPLLVSYGPIIFRDLQALALSPDASRSEIRAMLLKACEVAGEQYRKLRETKSVLPQMIVPSEAGREKMLREYLSGPKTRELSEHGLVADPYFLGDGITEQYIAHEYSDTSPRKKKAFTVEGVCFAANAEKTLIVRSSGWRNRLTMLGEWDGQYYKHDLIVKFLEDIVSIMLTLIEED